MSKMTKNIITRESCKKELVHLAKADIKSAIVLLLASILAFLAGAIGLTYLFAQEMGRLEGAEPLFPGAEAFVIMSYVIIWVLGIFILLVLLAICWIIGLVLAVILTFFMKQKPLWLSILSAILFAIYVILVICILIPVVPGVLVLLFLILFG